MYLEKKIIASDIPTNSVGNFLGLHTGHSSYTKSYEIDIQVPKFDENITSEYAELFPSDILHSGGLNVTKNVKILDSGVSSFKTIFAMLYLKLTV